MSKVQRGTFLLVVIGLLTSALAAQERTVKIVFTQIPPAGGGPDSRGDIAGKVQGLDRPESYKVVLYAHTDRWYVQPLADAPHTDIANDGKWSNWTHLGHRYAALVVRPSFRPPATCQSLPGIGPDVIAKKEVPARKKRD